VIRENTTSTRTTDPVEPAAIHRMPSADLINTLAGQRSWCVAVGHVLDVLSTIPDETFHCCATSPPYWGLREYGTEHQAWHDGWLGSLGREPTPEMFIGHLVDVFREVRRVLRDDGVCWVNIGDSYNAYNRNRGASTSVSDGTRGRNHPEHSPGLMASGLKPGDLCMIPHRLAIALQADGWFVRQDMCWAKKSPMPESLNGWRWVRCRRKTKSPRQTDKSAGNGPDGPQSVMLTRADREGRAEQPSSIPCPGCDKCRDTDGLILRRGSWRTTRAHEFIFQLTKSPQYFCDAQAVAEAVTGNAHARGHSGVHAKSHEQGTGVKQNDSFESTVRHLVQTRNPRSVVSFRNEPANWDFCLNCGTLYQGPDRKLVKTKRIKGKPVPVRICPTCKSTDSWVDHFATFPSALPEWCIKASTSEKGCCPECGAQWARIIEHERIATRPGDKNAVDESGKSNRDAQRHVAVTKTIGWRPTCNCTDSDGKPFTPIEPLVLEPFCGSGRSIIAARAMNCRAVGIELNAKYAVLANALIGDDSPLFS